MALNRLVTRQFRQNAVCQLFAQFDAPLIKRIDIHNHALNKNLMFVHSDQSPEAKRSDGFQQDGVGRAVTLKDFKRRDIIHFSRIFALCGKLRIHLFTGFAEGQCFGLREEIRQQFAVMIPQRIMALCRCDKITRDQFGALMDQLIKRMLPVGAGSPQITGPV